MGDPFLAPWSEWSGAVGWATLISPVVPSGAVLWDGRSLFSPVVPSGAVLWAGRSLFSPVWSRVERCCGLGDPLLAPVVPGGAVLWAGRSLFSPCGPEWSGAVGWAIPF